MRMVKEAMARIVRQVDLGPGLPIAGINKRPPSTTLSKQDRDDQRRERDVSHVIGATTPRGTHMTGLGSSQSLMQAKKIYHCDHLLGDKYA